MLLKSATNGWLLSLLEGQNKFTVGLGQTSKDRRFHSMLENPETLYQVSLS